jgi:tape measure domain-containing protein
MANDRTLELQIRIAAEEAARIVSSLKGEMKALADESGKYAKNEGAALNRSFKDSEAAAKNTVSSIGDIKRAVGSLVEVAAAAKALSVIKDMGAFALQTADNFQTAKNQFGILLGDMEAGAGLFNEIKKFNDVTPFDLDTLTQATNVLISAKVPLKDLQAQLTKFGDLSQGNSQKMTSYVNAFSQAAAKGKADMQVLNTYLHQGVPILDELAKNFNVTTAEIVEMSSKGQISFADFSKALDNLTAAGGQYFGGMELASKSLAAMQEGLSEATNTLSASFGEMFLPVAIAVVEVLTNITNAINESPMLKGLFIGAIVALTGYLSAMAVKATIAFAAQMSLNFAIGAMNPVVLASTIAVAGLAAGYVAQAARMQSAAKESENFALSLKKQSHALNDAAGAAKGYADSFSSMSGEDIARQMRLAETRVNQLNREIQQKEEALEELGRRYREEGIEDLINKHYDGRASPEQEEFITQIGRLKLQLEAAKAEMNALRQGYRDFRNEISSASTDERDDWISKMFGSTQAAKIQQLNEQLAIARKYLSDSNLGSGDQSKLQEIIKNLNEEIDKLTNSGPDINRIAAEWKAAWAEVWGQFKADQENDPFYRIELEKRKKLADAEKNYILSGNKETIDQINEYYASQRSEVIKKLEDEEKRMQRELSKSRIDDISHEYDEAMKAIDKLEAQRIIAAANSEAEIQAIRERFASMREEIVLQFTIEIEKTQLEEARDSVKNWQQELSDKLTLALMDIKDLSAQASVIIGDLATQLLSLSASAALSGFEEFGRALGEGKDAAESLQQALAHMAQQILKQLPMMFMQAGLQLIANGQWALGLGFIAAAGSSAIISGYVDGASKNAQGNVFDEYGKAAQAFAAGGTFTNQIVNQPTYFRFGGSLGVMGEAGPEAIMPLKRMSNGNLGVEGANGGTNVVVNIFNNSNAEVRQEEKTDNEGNKQIDVMIGQLIDNHITSGKADRAMSRYNVRPGGV